MTDELTSVTFAGVEFMMAAQAFYCSICSTFSGDGACAEHHLKSKEHNDAYKVSLLQYTLPSTQARERSSLCVLHVAVSQISG